MRYVRLIFTDFKDEAIAETAVLRIIGQSRFRAFSGDSESTRV
jgi:hypothetical protein